MARLNLGDLKSKRKFRHRKYAGRKKSHFNRRDASKEDRERSRLVEKTVPSLAGGHHKKAKRLAKRLRYEDGPPATIASSAHYDDKRQPLLDHLVKLTHAIPTADLRVVTLLPNHSKLNSLEGFDPKVFLERLRADLTRAGAREANGWIFASVHGEHRSNPHGWYPHYHLVAVGKEMIEAVKRLRNQRKYTKPPGSPPAGKKKWPAPVRLAKVGRGELRYALSYALQTWWPERWDGDGKLGKKRASGHKRIPGVDHTNFLIWLDQQKFHKMHMLFNLRVGRKGLEATNTHKVRQ